MKPLVDELNKLYKDGKLYTWLMSSQVWNRDVGYM